MTWTANPQQWAIDAGLPEPEEGETWGFYLMRLGVSKADVLELLVELTDRTSGQVTYRFTEYLKQNGFAQHWNAYVEERAGKWTTAAS